MSTRHFRGALLAALVLIASACGQVSDLENTVETASEERSVDVDVATTAPVDGQNDDGDSSRTAGAPSERSTSPADSGSDTTTTADQATGSPGSADDSDGSGGTTSVIPSVPASTSAPSSSLPESSAEASTTTEAPTTTSTTAPPTTLEGGTEDPNEQATSSTTSSSTTAASPTTQADGDALSAPPTTSTSTTTAAPTTTTTVAEAVSVPDPVPSLASGTAEVAMVAGESINVYSSLTDANADWTFGRATQFGNPTVFLIAGESGSRYKVLLPVRKKHTYGWIDQADVNVSTTDFRAVVSLSTRSVTVYSGSDVISSSKAVIGKSSTPTPVGQFYVTDKLRHANPGGAYGPWILALSARSEALTSFNGGEPIVALHGTNKPWLVGGRHSNGCIRLPNDVITDLAKVVPLGTPVDVVA